DFGFGWSLGFGDPKLRTNLTDDAGSGWGGYAAMKDGARVYVTMPGGERQGYTFHAQLVNQFFGIYAPAFDSDAGDVNALTVPNVELNYDEFTGEYYTLDEN